MCNKENLLAYNVVNTYAGRYFYGKKKEFKRTDFYRIRYGPFNILDSSCKGCNCDFSNCNCCMRNISLQRLGEESA